MAAVTFITATYNKPDYLLEVAVSIQAQKREDWVWWIILNGPTQKTDLVTLGLFEQDERISVFYESTTDEQRSKYYMPAVISNKFFPKISTRYFTWVSDDDILEPNFTEILAGALDSDPEKEVVFGACEVKRIRHDSWVTDRWLRADRAMGRGTGLFPDCVIDSGQILQTKDSYNALNYKIPEGWDTAAHVDGIYMNALARHFTFYNIPVKVLNHRCTPLSTFVKS